MGTVEHNGKALLSGIGSSLGLFSLYHSKVLLHREVRTPGVEPGPLAGQDPKADRLLRPPATIEN